MESARPWHRLFGMSLVDFFRGTNVQVELETDLSLKKQLLDVVILHKSSSPLTRTLPDGFEELAAHNLITFKSHQESLDGWAVNELIGHYVNYRKQISESMQDLLPESDFRLFAVCVRLPQGLMSRTPVIKVGEGVYDLRHFTGELRVIVVHELPRHENNAMFHLFSARRDLLKYGTERYRRTSDETSTLLMQLSYSYRTEGIAMPDILDEYVREVKREVFQEMFREMPIEERLKGLSAEERLRGLTVEELLAALPDDARKAISERLKKLE